MLIDHTPLVNLFAHRWATALPSGLDVEDLQQVGKLALLEALSRWDPSRGANFRTFAAWRVNGAMGDEIRRMRWISRHTEIDKFVKLIDLRRAQSLPITSEAMALETGHSIEKIRAWELRIAQAQQQNRTLSDVESGYADEKDGPRGAVMLQVPDGAPSVLTQVVERERFRLLHAAVDQLPDRMRTIISLHYFEGMTNANIGKLVLITESRVSQIISEAHAKLKEALEIVDLETPVPFSVINPLPVVMAQCDSCTCLYVRGNGYSRQYCSRQCRQTAKRWTL